MRIGVLSDTHDQRERTRFAADALRDAGVEAFFHCGDFVDADMLELLSARPCYFVFGNNDRPTTANLQRTARRTGAVCLDRGGIVDLAGKRIAITHGHLKSELRKLAAAQPDLLLSGHSHRASDERVNSIRRINPGALRRASRFTVAWLDLESDELQFLEIPRHPVMKFVRTPP
jgi:putative phosphoesterase